MKALRSFAVRAALPPALEPLSDIAMNLRWAWVPQTIDLFRWVDADAWERSGHDPALMLGMVSARRWTELAADGPFTTLLTALHEDLEDYLHAPRWYQQQDNRALRRVAYFSPEFGVSEALPVYSGGLGVLAGDHLKASSDLGIPLVGVGLLYREGYFRQQLNADGWQVERYPALDPHAMPLSLLQAGDGSPLKIEIDLAGARCVAQVWNAQIGRVPLLLLDCDVEENDTEERGITDRLYGGGSEHRLRQEIVLGIGGVRAVKAAGYEVDVYHSNEGHAGFLGLERIRALVTEGLTLTEVQEYVRATTVFTTHTPVPAGIDVYEGELMKRYFSSFAKECDVSFEQLLALGQAETPKEPPGSFNMAVMGLRLAARANGVSELHGEVARSMFAPLWPNVPVDEVPITSITNGVHMPTWVGPEMIEVYNRHLTPRWAESSTGGWERALDIPDAELWRARERARERLIYSLREHLRRHLLARGVSDAEAAWTEDVFDPGALTIGFARRFAQYKRATLLFSDFDRLKRLILSRERPVQVVVAGKAHPHDDGGKEMIRRIVHFASDPDVRARLVFAEDYDMSLARAMVQGCDVWLNNPRRPLEACGTSGMKAALNGVLNCSVLDGWWAEVHDGRNGWAVGTADTYEDHEYQDRVDSRALYDVLERDIIPRFYDRSEGPIPRRWVERVRASLATLGPFVNARRMVRDYVDLFYEPAALAAKVMTADGYRRARDLAAWKEHVTSAWPEVRVIDVEGDVLAADVGDTRSVRAVVHIGRLSPGDVRVELAHGPVGANGEIQDPEVEEMSTAGSDDGTCTYQGSFEADAAGLYGFAVRVIPAHPDLTTRMDLGLIAWA